jgi:hypothetical protein
VLRGYALAQLLAQHLGNYAGLGTAAAVEYRNAVARRLVLALVAAVAGFAGVAALWTTGLAALWDTQWRLVYIGASAAVLLATAFWALGAAMTDPADGPAVRTLKSELNKDLELFEQWKRTRQ